MVLPYQEKPKMVVSSDRTDQHLVVFAGLNNFNQIDVGEDNTRQVTLTGLKPNTFYPENSFGVAYYNSQGNGSARLMLPAFTTKPRLMESFDFNTGSKISGTLGSVLEVIPGNYKPLDTTNTDVTANSQNPDIASIEYNGQKGLWDVTLNSIGSTIIDFKAVDGGSAKNSLTVEVIPKPDKPGNVQVTPDILKATIRVMPKPDKPENVQVTSDILKATIKVD